MANQPDTQLPAIASHGHAPMCCTTSDVGDGPLSGVATSVGLPFKKSSQPTRLLK